MPGGADDDASRRQGRRSATVGARLTRAVGEASFAWLRNDARWREPLLATLKAQAGEQILDVATGSVRVGIDVGLAFPAANIISLGRYPRVAEVGRAMIEAHHIDNVDVVVAGAGRLPFEQSSIDRVVSYLALHALPSGEKLLLLREFFRVLRRGGTLHVAELDQPDSPYEHIALTIARLAYGGAATAPHVDGSWVGLPERAGFTGVRKLSSHSFPVAKLAILRARRW